jgi:hypothetical protein
MNLNLSSLLLLGALVASAVAQAVQGATFRYAIFE